MASAVLMPKLGNSVESSIILAWHKAIGERVVAGDLLAEIETDKATLEVEAPRMACCWRAFTRPAPRSWSWRPSAPSAQPARTSRPCGHR